MSWSRICGGSRASTLFLTAITNAAGERLTFVEALSRSGTHGAIAAFPGIPTPSLDGMILLKKCRLPHPRDEEDLRYLAVLKHLREGAAAKARD